MGSGDAYVLFQLGPRNSWLVEAYKRSVRLTLSAGIVGDAFGASLIPAETDIASSRRSVFQVTILLLFTMVTSTTLGTMTWDIFPGMVFVMGYSCIPSSRT